MPTPCPGSRMGEPGEDGALERQRPVRRAHEGLCESGLPPRSPTWSVCKRRACSRSDSLIHSGGDGLPRPLAWRVATRLQWGSYPGADRRGIMVPVQHAPPCLGQRLLEKPSPPPRLSGLGLQPLIPSGAESGGGVSADGVVIAVAGDAIGPAARLGLPACHRPAQPAHPLPQRLPGRCRRRAHRRDAQKCP